MWGVESSSAISKLRENERVGFYAPSPAGGHEATIAESLTISLGNQASTGGHVRLVVVEYGAEKCVRRAMTRAEEQWLIDSEKPKEISGFNALDLGNVADTDLFAATSNNDAPGEEKGEGEAADPNAQPIDATQRLFIVLRLDRQCHRFPETARDQAKAMAKELGVEQVDLVTIPWADDSREPSRRVRNQQAEAFLRTWQKGIVPLQDAGFVKNIGVDNLNTWQLERLADSPNCPMPSFHLVKVSPGHGKFDEVRFCQAKSIECIALLTAETGRLAAGDGGEGEDEGAGEGKEGEAKGEDEAQEEKGAEDEAEIDVDEPPAETPLARVSREVGHSERQTLVAWALQRGMVAVPAPSLPDPTLLSNARAYSTWQQEEVRRVAEIYALLHPFARRPLYCSKNLIHVREGWGCTLVWPAPPSPPARGAERPPSPLPPPAPSSYPLPRPH